MISRELSCELRTKGMQIGCYEPGTHYVKHRDASPLVPDRRLTAILYLNKDWDPADGGQIRLHINRTTVDIQPEMDRLLLFHSDLEHEVLFTSKRRFALTMWFYGDTDLAPPLAPYATRDPLSEPLESISHIFVSVAAYRDPDTNHTVHSLLSTATHPNRLRVGIHYQDHDVEDKALHAARPLPAMRSHQIRIMRTKNSDAAGPAYARRKIVDALWSREALYLQVDSHMRFVQGWDVELIRLLRGAPTRRSVITFYPVEFDGDGVDVPPGPYGPTVLRYNGLDGDGMPRVVGTLTFPPPTVEDWPDDVAETDALVRQRFAAAGFFFGLGDVVEVIYGRVDGSTDGPEGWGVRGLFFGEEAAMAARLWTAGWEMWTPRDPGLALAFHRWERRYRKTFQENFDADDGLEGERRVAQRRVRVLLGFEEFKDGDPELEGLGDGGNSALRMERSLQSFLEHAGMK
ncbi:Egl nine 3 [Irineochytrium annulatum]|nr:Egl nine 3 [Irineochytrium annulatum]